VCASSRLPLSSTVTRKTAGTKYKTGTMAVTRITDWCGFVGD
jgi:hypothetical protein